MNLLSVELENFKYHEEIILDCQGKNTLVYGENGAGKTSVYKAIYSLLYHHKDKGMRSEDFQDNYINKDNLTEDLKVKADIQGSTLERNNNQITGREVISAENANVFMLEAKDLDRLLEGDFDKQISRHFGNEYEVETIYRSLLAKINSGKASGQSEAEHQKELRDFKTTLDATYKQKIISLIDVVEINRILEQKFHWKEKVVFEIEASEIDFSIHPYKSNPPKITIFLKNDTQETDVTEYLNEAKLKVLALTFYLCGMLKQQRKEINTLVLDDFVNSLDMANRRFIVDALVSNLEGYQFLIFTHNIHFYELIKKVLRNFDQANKWSFQKLIDFSSGSKFISDTGNYLVEAKERLDCGDYEASANYLRKQFELILQQLKEKLHLGKVEKLNVLFDELKSGQDNFYEKPHDLIKELLELFNQVCEMVDQSEFSSYEILANEFQEKINARKIVKDKDSELLIEINLIKDILLNPASHGNPENVVHKSECEYAYSLIKKLTDNLKKTS